MEAIATGLKPPFLNPYSAAAGIFLLSCFGRMIHRTIISLVGSAAIVPALIIGGLALVLPVRAVVQRCRLAISPLTVLPGLLLLVITVANLRANPEEIAHLYGYATLSLVMWEMTLKATPQRRLLSALRAFSYTVGVGLADEGIQVLHPQRVGDLRDVVINCIGAGTMFLLFRPTIELQREAIPDSSLLGGIIHEPARPEGL